jgi:hypothetical protein
VNELLSMDALVLRQRQAMNLCVVGHVPLALHR